MSYHTRRDFIKKTILAAGFMSQLGFHNEAWANDFNGTSDNLDVSIFSKHLQFLDYKSLGAKARELGFSGVDLTVRNKGHVLPEKVKIDLPKAIEAIKKAGSTCNMITTSVESIQSQTDVAVLKTASECGITFYRTNWFEYSKNLNMVESIQKYKRQLDELIVLNKELGLVGCYQNHAGKKIGASFWEIYQLLEGLDSNFFGTQYDIRHAMLEGTYSWENGLKLLKPYIKTIVLKDCKWEKINGVWKVVNVPIGEGMVNFDSYFKLLKMYNLMPPISLHLEYDLGGAEKGSTEILIDKQVVYDAMKKDLITIQKLWRAA